MISRIQSSCKKGVKFEDAMTQALSEILQNLQVIDEDTKKPRCRKASVPAIWYGTAGATEGKTTTFNQSNIKLERRFSEITTSVLSTMSSLQSLEEEKVNTEQGDISLGCQDKVIEEVSAEKLKEDEDVKPRELVSAPVGGTSETKTLMQPKAEMERKMFVFTAPALTAMPSLQSLEEEEGSIDKVDVSLGCRDKVIQEVSPEEQREDEDIKPRGLVSAPVRGTSETTTLMQPKKKMGRKFSVFTAPALSATTSLQSLDEEKVNIGEVDIGLGNNDNAIQEVTADKQREGVYMPLRRRASAPVIGTSETTILEQPKTEMTSSVFAAPVLSALPSLQSLDEEEVSVDKVSIGLGCQDKGIEEGIAEKQREHEDIQPRRRKVSAPVTGTSETTTLKQAKEKIKRKFSLFASTTLSATLSLQSLDEEKVDIDTVDMIFQDKVDEEVSEEKQNEDIDMHPRRRRISAPVIGTSKPTTLKQAKNKIKRKFSVFAAPSLSASPSLQSLDEEEKVDIGLGYQNKAVIQQVSAEKQRDGVDIMRRRRRTSAPAYRTSETKSPKQAKKKTRGKFSLFAAPALSATPSLRSLDEEKVGIDEVDIGFGVNDRAIDRDTKKQPRRRRVSAPARTHSETAETTAFKQLKKDFVRKMSRPTFLPDLPLSTMPWLADCVNDQIEEDFEPVEFNLSFLDDLMKSV